MLEIVGKIGSFIAKIRKNHAYPQLVIQYTTLCNATCPQCGMRKGSQITRKTLNKDYLKQVIDYAVSEWNLQFLSFTGGEPFLFLDDIIELIDYAGNQGVKYIRTGTNGFIFQYYPTHIGKFEKRVYSIAEKLSQTKLYTLWISLDSSDPNLHEEMRGFQGLIRGIEKALPILEEFGIYPAANLGINRNVGGKYTPDEITNFDKDRFYERYRKGFSDFYQRVIDMGFTISNTCYPMNLEIEEAAYHATSQDHIVSFRAEEKAVLFQALYDTISYYRSKIRIFTPIASIYTLMNFYGNNRAIEYPCRGGIDFFYLDAQNGHVYPCGYRSEDDLGEIWDIDLEALQLQKPKCLKCDWECFRDPTELLEPLIDIYHHPLSSIKKMLADEKMRLWVKDMLYFSACDLFNGRKPPDYDKMKKFIRPTLETENSGFMTA
jgi:MoaA/NifB/PqqE/SkfB family radical SAM enzyme